MVSVAYTCSFVPCEVIAAGGAQPRRVLPSVRAIDAAGFHEGVCPFNGAFVQAASADDRIDAIVLTSVCDQMRRSADALAMACSKPVLLLHVPATWQRAEPWRLYVDELRRLGRFVTGLTGRPIENGRLSEIMLDCDRRRRALRDRRAEVSARAFVEAVVALPGGDLPETSPPANGPTLAVIGGELVREDLAAFDAIEAAGGRVVLNATDFGERGLPDALDRRAVRDDPFQELARAYFGSIPHAFRRPNGELYRYLQRELAARNVRGIIFRRYAWCDTWNAELQRLREWVGLPVLDLDMGGEEGCSPRVIGRIEAFMETLQ